MVPRLPRLRDEENDLPLLPLYVKEFIAACTGAEHVLLDGSQHDEHRRYAAAYAEYIELQARKGDIELPPATGLIEPCGEPHQQLNALYLTTKIARVISKYEQRELREMRIDKVVEHLVEARILNESCLGESKNAARHLVFCSVGWYSMLYKPREQFYILDGDCFLSRTDCNTLQIEQEAREIFAYPVQPSLVCSSRLTETLHRFGCLLPSRLEGAQDNKYSDDLQVSLLNVSHLAKIGRVKVQWVHSIGAHMSFEDEKLRVFKLPSYCFIHGKASSPIKSIIDKFHESRDQLHGFSADALFEEVLRSYQLLFRNNEDSRKYYKKLRKKLLKDAVAFVDPYLDVLCGKEDLGRTVVENSPRSSFSKKDDFPILGDRFSRLQEYMARMKPRRVRGLWQDRSDMKDWYTFWAVIWLGGLGLLLSLISMIAGVIQAIYTVKAFRHSSN